MGIKTVTKIQVGCQDCEATILVDHWHDAREHGWAVPADGMLQLCPVCVRIRQAVLMATAVPVGLLADKLPGEK